MELNEGIISLCCVAMYIVVFGSIDTLPGPTDHLTWLPTPVGEIEHDLK